MKIDVDVKGLEEAIIKMKRYSDSKKKGVAGVVGDSAEKIKKSQVQKVPVLSGDTKESITVVMEKDGLGATIGPRLPLGYKRHWIEFGTTHHPPQPFIFPSYEENKAGYLNDIQKELGRTK